MGDGKEWQKLLQSEQRSWLVTGCAGFIGSHLVEDLLLAGQKVIGLDNFATGHRKNLDLIKGSVGKAWDNFLFIEGDITDAKACQEAVRGVSLVLHQAALGSVPRSIENPLATMTANVTGFLTMLEAARSASVKRFVYASSSSVYGTSQTLPKKETDLGEPLSPYALSKKMNEEIAANWNRVYGTSLVGLRYFNVFGARQDPNGPYAAVIPRWVNALLTNTTPEIFGDGKTTRDFCYVKNAVQANIRAALVEDARLSARVFNVSYGKETSLEALYQLIAKELKRRGALETVPEPCHLAFRAGDIHASLADLSLITACLGYRPEYSLEEGIAEALDHYTA